MLLVGQVLKKIKSKDISITSMVKKSITKQFTDLFKCSYDGMDLIENHKSICSLLIYVLYKEYGKDLAKQQEILLSMADIIIEIYASESTLLRSKKTDKVSHENMANFYLYEANQKIKEKSNEIIDSSSHGVKRVLLKKIINKLTNHTHVNPYLLY
jgi:hypothetical protein